MFHIESYSLSITCSWWEPTRINQNKREVKLRRGLCILGDHTFSNKKPFSLCIWKERLWLFLNRCLLAIGRAPSPDPPPQMIPPKSRLVHQSVYWSQETRPKLASRAAASSNNPAKEAISQELGAQFVGSSTTESPATVTTYVTRGRPYESCDFPNFLSL